VDQSSIFSERRAKPRIWCSYPAKVSGQDASGRAFEESAALDNLSASGLLIHLRTEIQPEANLSIVFRASRTSPLGQGKGPVIAVEGIVLRTQKQEDGFFGVAVKIHNHRFL
jgi:hypothetical protein